MKFLLLLCSCLLGNFVNAQTEEALLKKVKARLDKVTDYEASGKMKLDVSFINAPESKVTIYFKKAEQV